jgi:hypothetical protein
MRIVVAAVTAALLSLAVPAAQAAEPATGEVSASKVVQSWSGVAYGYPGKLLAPLDLQNHATCTQTLCDSFSLTVKDAGHLKVGLIAPASAEYVDVLVTKPDGTTEYLYGNDKDDFQEIVYEDAQTGTYSFDIWPNELPGPFYDGHYSGTAELCTNAFSECFLPPVEEEEF